MENKKEELGIVIGTPKQAFWKTMKLQAEQRILQNDIMREIDVIIIAKATEKLKNVEGGKSNG